MATNLILTGNTTPESVLLSVEDYSKINKSEDALEMVYAFLASKKVKNWSPSLEQLLKINIDLALEHNRLDLLEENLLIFRNICQTHHVESLNNVYDYYLAALEDRMKLAEEKVDNVEDLFTELNEQDDAQSFYFNSLSSKQGKIKERFKQSWRDLIKAYCVVLELTSKNKRLEHIYSETTKRMIAVILSHKAVNDFKQVNNLLKTHQQFNMAKATSGSFTLDLKNKETNTLLLELRFTQLAAAKQLDLTQEAFYIVEDINFLIFSMKVRLENYIAYYENLADVFLKGGFYYLHAIALLNHFINFKKQGSQADVQKAAARTLLACLSISTQSEEFWLSEQLLAQYQFLLPSALLDRKLQTLYDSLDKYNMIEIAGSEYKQLFNTITGKMDLYDFSKNIEEAFAVIPDNFKQYKRLISENSVTVILRLLSAFYENITFDELKEFTHFEAFDKVKQIIMLTLSNQNANIYLNYEKQLVEFRNNKITFNHVFEKYEEHVDNVRKVLQLIQKRVSRDSNRGFKEDLINRFRNYMIESSTIEEETKVLIKADRALAEEKIKEKPMDKALEEAYRIEMKFRKEEERRMIIERKMLDVKKKKVRTLLEIDPMCEVLNRPLKDFTDDEIVQLDFGVFESIENDIKTARIKRIDESFGRKFKLYDFLRRMVLKHQQQKFNEFNQTHVLNLDDLQKEKTTHEQNMKEKREKIIGAAGLVRKYIDKIKREKESEFNDHVAQYRMDLTKNYGEMLMKEALDKIAKAKEEVNKATALSRGTGFKPNMMQMGDRPGMGVPTKLERGTNFVAKPMEGPNPTPVTSMARRGEGVPAQTKLMPTETPVMGLAKRGTGQMNPEPLKEPFKKPAEPEKNPVMAKRGTEMKKEEPPKAFGKGFGLSKPEEAPKTLTRGTGFTKPEGIKAPAPAPAPAPFKLERAKK